MQKNLVYLHAKIIIYIVKKKNHIENNYMQKTKKLKILSKKKSL